MEYLQNIAKYFSNDRQPNRLIGSQLGDDGIAQEQQDSCDEGIDVPAEYYQEVLIEFKVLHPGKMQ